MKTIPIFFKSILLIFVLICSVQTANAQIDIDSTKTYIIIKNDGTQFVGKILSIDEREVLLQTPTMGNIIIPRHEISKINEARSEDLNRDGSLKRTELFATRYFISTNGLSTRKGDSYVMWGLFGPDLQYGISDDVSLGLMTSWMGVPVIGSLKYSKALGEENSFAVGTLLGTGSWAAPEFGLALPYASFTVGNRSRNLTFSAGYGMVWHDTGSDGQTLLSVAGMTKMTEKLSFIFDSFILTGGEELGVSALIIPGIRLQTENNRAFQLGFAGLAADGILTPTPIPMLGWFRKL